MIPATIFIGVDDVTGARYDLSVTDFIGLLRGEGEIVRDPADKLASPMLSTATYSGTRSKANAITATAIALDIDEDGADFDTVVDRLDRLWTPYVAHTTTKSRPEAHRFRVILFLNRAVAADEYEILWAALGRYLELKIDPVTRDISRLSVMPAEWAGAYNDFASADDGPLIDVDVMIRHFAPPPPPRETPVWQKRMFDAYASTRATFRAREYTAEQLCDLDTSPILSRGIVERAMTYPKGTRVYRLLCSAASTAKAKCIPIDRTILIAIARSFSQRLGRKPAKGENERDADRALKLAF